MTYQNIIFEVEGSIGKISFNRPKALNALNHSLLDEFGDAVKKVDQNEDIKVLVLTGTGEKAFVAGADIEEINKTHPLNAKLFCRKGLSIIGQLEELSIPVIAAVNGFALGGGCEMALACDFIYAADTAMFGLPEITLGIIPGFGGTQRLQRIVGRNVAKEMIFTGKMISALEAKEIGIANKVVPAAELMDVVMKVAGSISKKGKISLRSAKHAVNAGMDVDITSGCKIETDCFVLCMMSEDVKEGTSAFLEKRKPEFKGPLMMKQ